MSIDRLKNRIIAAFGIWVPTALGFSTEALAQKPGGGVSIPSAPGTIYFHTMSGDGSGKRAVPPFDILSNLRHAGVQWSLHGDTADGTFDPGGSVHLDLFATDRIGHWYQLTSNPDIQVYDLVSYA